MENSNAKLPKLTVDIFNRPDCPEWARYAAVDEGGWVYVYPDKPNIAARNWDAQLYSKATLMGINYDSSDWANSLIERPEVEREHPKLTVDIFNRPDCPEWAQYAAVDADGSGHVFVNKPERGVLSWRRCSYIGVYDASGWEDSLIERPAKSGSTPAHDDVSAPAYYVNTPFGVEVRKITEHYDPYIAAALQYIFRNGQKVYDGLTAKESAIKDLRKAIQNIKFEIEKIENS